MCHSHWVVLYSHAKSNCIVTRVRACLAKPTENITLRENPPVLGVSRQPAFASVLQFKTPTLTTQCKQFSYRKKAALNRWLIMEKK